MNFKRRKDDELYTELLRKLRKYKCEKCGRVYKDNLRNLGVSHYHGRRKENVRFDYENTDLLCTLPCHQYFEENPHAYREWKIKKLGKIKYDMLALRAEFYCKRDVKKNVLWIKE